jgi:uncharacterized protein YndB with AHSA1/START domain
MSDKTLITVETTVNAPVETAWQCWTTPACIMQWNSASDDWHTPRATVDLREGGEFSSRMEAKDGSMGFDFAGVYTKVVPNQTLEYAFGDRTTSVTFEDKGGSTHIIETFEAETENSVEMQKQGWQSILENFKKHAEAHTAS